jgi:holo-[acyl-carrier protein] synthase
LRIGIDLVLVSDVVDSRQRFGERYLRRLFTPDELAYCLSDDAQSAPRLAARFAAKEATRKALRLLDQGLDWKQIEVRRAPQGWCELQLHGETAELARSQHLESFSVSLSHEADYATAVVLAHSLQGHP